MGSPSRWKYLLLAVTTVAAGLFSRTVHTGWHLADKSLGDALYSLMIYWLLALLLPRLRPVQLALSTTAFCFAIEAFKLSGLPASWSHSLVSRLVFGTTPSLHNLICYLAGAAAAGVVDSLLRRQT
jgi:hypothetical protein